MLDKQLHLHFDSSISNQQLKNVAIDVEVSSGKSGFYQGTQGLLVQNGNFIILLFFIY